MARLGLIDELKRFDTVLQEVREDEHPVLLRAHAAVVLDRRAVLLNAKNLLNTLIFTLRVLATQAIILDGAGDGAAEVQVRVGDVGAVIVVECRADNAFVIHALYMPGAATVGGLVWGEVDVGQLVDNLKGAFALPLGATLKRVGRLRATGPAVRSVGAGLGEYRDALFIIPLDPVPVSCSVSAEFALDKKARFAITEYFKKALILTSLAHR